MDLDRLANVFKLALHVSDQNGMSSNLETMREPLYGPNPM